MPYKLRTGVGITDPRTIAQMARVTYAEEDNTAVANTKVYTAITKQNPILGLILRLTGNLVVATATATAKIMTPWSIINRLTLEIDGSQFQVNVEGRLLPIIHQLYEGFAPYSVAPALTAGTNAFESLVFLPLDVGNYTSCLDASRNNSLNVGVTWADETAIATAGGGGTIAMSAVKLGITTVAIAGGQLGMPGGVDWQYSRHNLVSQAISITGANTERIVTLTKARVYSGLTFVQVSDAALVDTILNSAIMQIGQSQIQKLTNAQMKGLNYSRYRLPAVTTWAGIKQFDVGDPEHLEQTVAITGGQDLEISLDVSHPGTTDTLTILEDTHSRAF